MCQYSFPSAYFRIGSSLLYTIPDFPLSLFQTKAPGRILFEQVCKQLNLLEVDYFGLEYQDSYHVTVRKTRAPRNLDD